MPGDAAEVIVNAPKDEEKVVDLQTLYTEAVHALEASEQADKTARLQLYTLIQKLARLAKEGQADEKAFNAFCRKNNVPQPKDSDVFTKTIHLVWKDEKAVKSNMRYATVLRYADAVGKTAYDIPAWLNENEGVEATLRKARKHFNPDPSEEELNKAKDITDKLLASIVPLWPLSEDLPKVPKGHSLLLVRKDEAGKTSVVRVLTEDYVNPSLIDTALDSVAQREFEVSSPFAAIMAAERIAKFAKSDSMFVVNRDNSATIILTGQANQFGAAVIPEAIAIMSVPRHIGQFPDGVSYWRGRDINPCFHFYKYKANISIDPNSTYNGNNVVLFKQVSGQATVNYMPLSPGHTGMYFVQPKKHPTLWQFDIDKDLIRAVAIVDTNLKNKKGNELIDAKGKVYQGARFLHLKIDNQQAAFSDPVGHTIGRVELKKAVSEQINIYLPPRTFTKVATLLADRCDSVKMYGSDESICFTGTDEQKIAYRIYVPQLKMLPGKAVMSGDWCETTDYIEQQAGQGSAAKAGGSRKNGPSKDKKTPDKEVEAAAE